MTHIPDIVRETLELRIEGIEAEINSTERYLEGSQQAYLELIADHAPRLDALKKQQAEIRGFLIAESELVDLSKTDEFAIEEARRRTDFRTAQGLDDVPGPPKPPPGKGPEQFA